MRSGKTKIFSWLMVVLFLGAIFVGGCGQKSPAPSTNGSSEGPAREYKPVELNFATWQPPQYPNNTQVFEPFAASRLRKKLREELRFTYSRVEFLPKEMKHMMLL
jgi:hypothetical protein